MKTAPEILAEIDRQLEYMNSYSGFAEQRHVLTKLKSFILSTTLYEQSNSSESPNSSKEVKCPHCEKFHFVSVPEIPDSCEHEWCSVYIGPIETATKSNLKGCNKCGTMK